jgi:hypothetical protein
MGGDSGRAAWYGQNNVGLVINEWLEIHQKHNYYSKINEYILHNIYHCNIISHVLEEEESIGS